MSNPKIDALMAERCMGWREITMEPKERYPFVMWERPGMDNLPTGDWCPSVSLDDAVMGLEKVSQGKGYSIYKFPDEKKPYDVELEAFKFCTDAETLPLAMCLCALRAAGCSQAELEEAIK